jgi:hypothetical protein
MAESSSRFKGMRIASGIVAALVGVVGLACLGHIAAQPPAPIGGDDFARAVRSAASNARETAMLCAAIEKGRLSGPYARTHREKLHEDLADETKPLKDYAPPRLAADADRARSLVAELSALQQELERHIADPDALPRLRGDAVRIAVDLARLEPT